MKIILVFLTAMLTFKMAVAEDAKYVLRVIHGEATYSDLYKILLENDREKDNQEGSFNGIHVITSYSIHYTKLYEWWTLC